MNENRKVKSTHEYIRNHLSERFPKLPSYAFYIQRPNRISPAFSGLPPPIRNDFPQPPGPEFIRLIDSVPIMIAKARRGGGAEVAREIAATGYNSTKKTYYCGLELHVPALGRDGRLPPPDYIGVTAANEADISVLKEIADDPTILRFMRIRLISLKH